MYKHAQDYLPDLSLSEKLHSRTSKMSQLMKCLPPKNKDLVQIPSTHTKNWTRSFESIPPMLKDGKGKSQGIPLWLTGQTASLKQMDESHAQWTPVSKRWRVIHAWTTVLHTHWHTPTHTHSNTYIIHVQGVTNTPYSHCEIHFNSLDTVELHLSDLWGNIKLTKHIQKPKPNSWVKQHQNVGKCWQWVILFTIRYV